MAAEIFDFPSREPIAPLPGEAAGLDVLRECAAVLEGKPMPAPRGERAHLVRIAATTLARISEIDQGAGSPYGGDGA